MYETLRDTASGSFHAGRPGECLAQCEHALAQFPGDEPLLVLKALALNELGRYAEAADVFRALAERQPDSPHHWSNLGLMLRYDGRFEDADRAFTRALAVAPRTYLTLVNHGLLLLDMGKLGQARHRFLDALEVNPSSAEAAIYAASTCFECGDLRRAAELIPPPQVWPSLQGDLRHDLAMALIHVGRTAEAEEVLDPDAFGGADPKAIARLAMLHERTNRLDSARALLARIPPVRADDDRDLLIDALTVESALAMRDKDYGRAETVTTQLLASNLPAPAQANAWFNLATIADRQGQRDLAMDRLAKAHAIQFQLATEIVPEFAGDDEPLQVATRWLEPAQARFAKDPVPAPRSPVFIVGFPRSGTTMLEQMLDAHPAYKSMDEQPVLQRCIERMRAFGLEYPYALDQLDADAIDQVRSVYWAEVDKIATLSPGETLVDKNPLNLLRLPMIARLFPDARIILALRHPCDVLLSCYMQNFRSPAFMILCSSLERLARSYVNSMASWIHHEGLLQPNVLKLRYEETVADFPAQVERIADFLGIEDREPLAAFSQHAARKRYISTPSYSQVIEPVNTRAVARWHAYRSYFAPVLPILQPVADHWRYDFT